jgi:hypothetical protein
MQEPFHPEQPALLALAIVVPCFNEEPGLQELVRRCCESAAASVGEHYELILVDAGSTDGTWAKIRSEIGRYPNIVAIKLSRNFGHQIAPGWTSIMISIIVAAFFQLIVLSVIGEYVGRIYISSKDRPLFIVDAMERRTTK